MGMRLCDNLCDNYFYFRFEIPLDGTKTRKNSGNTGNATYYFNLWI